MALVNVTKAFSQTLSGSPSTSYTIKHNLGTDSPVIDFYNGSDERVIPASVVADDANNVTITFSVSTTGRVYVV